MYVSKIQSFTLFDRHISKDQQRLQAQNKLMEACLYTHTKEYRYAGRYLYRYQAHIKPMPIKRLETDTDTNTYTYAIGYIGISDYRSKKEM